MERTPYIMKTSQHFNDVRIKRRFVLCVVALTVCDSSVSDNIIYLSLTILTLQPFKILVSKCEVFFRNNQSLKGLTR